LRFWRASSVRSAAPPLRAVSALLTRRWPWRGEWGSAGGLLAICGVGRIGVLVDSAPRSIRSTTSPTTRRSFPNRSRWDGRRRVRPSAWRRATSWALSPGRTFGEYPVDTDDPGDYAGLGHPVT